MSSRVLLAVPLALPLLAASLSAPDELTFSPREGLTLTKTFRTTSESESERSSDDRTSGSTTSSERVLVVTDTVQGVDGDRVTKLERRFDELASENESSFEFNDTSHEFSSSGTSEVQDETVVFEWDEEEEEMVAASDDVDDDVLEELLYDLDLAGFLPQDEVSEDDEWTVSPETFRGAMNPWKGLPWEFETTRDGETLEQRDVDDSDVERVEPEVDESEDGEIKATFRGTREANGVSVAVIELEGKIELERTVESSTEHEHGSSSFRTETSEIHTIEGELLWNVAGGHLHSLEIEVEISSSSSTESTFSFGDQEHSSTSEEERLGKTTYSVAFAADE